MEGEHEPQPEHYDHEKAVHDPWTKSSFKELNHHHQYHHQHQKKYENEWHDSSDNGYNGLKFDINSKPLKSYEYIHKNTVLNGNNNINNNHQDRYKLTANQASPPWDRWIGSSELNQFHKRKLVKSDNNHLKSLDNNENDYRSKENKV